MNTQYPHNPQTIISPAHTAGRAAVTHPETQQLLSLGRQQGWDVNILGRAPLPDAPVRIGDWLIVPSWQDTSPMPARALARVQAVYDAGIRPVGFFLAHEAPLQLPPPAEALPQTGSTWQRPSLPEWVVPALKVTAGTLGVLALGVVVITGLALLAAAVLTVAAVIAIPALLITAAVVLDPILIAVTEDGTWIEIDRWLA